MGEKKKSNHEWNKRAQIIPITKRKKKLTETGTLWTRRKKRRNYEINKIL